MRWTDEEVVAVLNQQNQWYKWQTQVAWAAFWDTYARQWQRPLDQVERELEALTAALAAFANQDVGDFTTRSAALYRKRVGVSYLLPVGGQMNPMEHFYERVLRELLERWAQDGRTDANPTVADLLKVLLGETAWPEAFQTSLEQSPALAVSYLREQVKTEIKTFLQAKPPGGQPLLPRLHDLLAQAAGHGRGAAAAPPSTRTT